MTDPSTEATDDEAPEAAPSATAPVIAFCASAAAAVGLAVV